MQLNLKEIRNKAGMSQDEIAFKLGIKTSRYGTWERGERMMSLQQAYEICDVLGCTLDELTGRKPPYSPKATPAIDEGEKMLVSTYRTLSPEQKRILNATAYAMSPLQAEAEKKRSTKTKAQPR